MRSIVVYLLLIVLIFQAEAQFPVFCAVDAECVVASDPCTPNGNCVDNVCVSACDGLRPSNFCDQNTATCNPTTAQCEFKEYDCVDTNCYVRSGGCDRTLNDGTGGCPEPVPIVCPSDNTPCMQQVCNVQNGLCESTPVVCPSDNNPCTQESCNAVTNTCESIPYVPSTCQGQDACITYGCNVEVGTCTFEPVVCEEDEDICTIIGCKSGSCVVTQNIVLVEFPNSTIYDCVNQQLVTGSGMQISFAKKDIISAYTNDTECVKIVTADDGSSGIYINCDQTVTITVVGLINMPLPNPSLDESTTLLLSTTDAPTDTTSLDVFDSYATDASGQPLVPACTNSSDIFCAQLSGTWGGEGVTGSSQTSCPVTESDSSGLTIFSFDDKCEPTSGKRSVAQTSLVTKQFEGNLTISFTLPPTNGPIFFKQAFLLVAASKPAPEQDCARSRCYWTENHASCTSAANEAQFPSTLCGIDAQTIFDADVGGDAWPMLAIETLTARDNCLCGGVACTEKQLGLLSDAYALLEANCANTPVSPGKGSPFGKFVSTSARLREITRENLCLDETEEEYKFCTPSVRKVQKCHTLNHNKRTAPSLTCDCHLEPVTPTGYGYYQFSSANLMGETLSMPYDNEGVGPASIVAVNASVLISALLYVAFRN